MNLITERGFEKVSFNDYEPFTKEIAHGFDYRMIKSKSINNKTVEFVWLQLESGCKRDFVETEGFEVIYMVQGKVDFKVGDEVTVIREGDTFFFDGCTPHVPFNPFNEPAIMIVIYFLY
ncbi:cupin domain-containing protein [Fulvivirgaceae bacterium BMA12]|uniref:Cupin domain-containing protein n=1 Tax=Agaribacillus aureus TaxID=3051825 RepID=A0ABT8LLC7_9BACT|nr:cupin domain-containing protein [Fulvivirgaceae bacterium BMA12]